MFSLAERRADGAFLDDVHGGRQRPGAQQEGQLLRFAQRQAGDAKVVAERRLNGGDADDPLLRPAAVRLDAFAVDLFHGDDGLVFDEDHRHAAADVRRRDIVEHFAALAVERDVHLRQAGFRITRLHRMGHAVAGENHALVQLHRAPLVGPFVDFRRPVVGGGDEAEFQIGELVDLALGVGAVLHAGQVDDDARAAELLHQGLRHAELVDAIAQAGQILLDGVAFDLVDLGLLHGDDEARPTVDIRFGEQIVGLAELVLDDLDRPIAQLRGSEVHADGVAGHGVVGAPIAHALLAQHVLDLLHFVAQALAKRLHHIHLQHEVGAAPEVQAQRHRLAAEVAQPLRRGRGQIQCHDILAFLAKRIEMVAQQGAGAQLVLAAGKADQAAVRELFAADHCDARLAKQLLDFRQQLAVYRALGVVRRYLQGEIRREEVGRRIQTADRDDHGEQRMAPSADAIRRPRLGFCRSASRDRANRRLGCCYFFSSSDLSVPFGSDAPTEDFWMRISTLLAMANLTKSSSTLVTEPVIPPAVTTSSPLARPVTKA